MRLAYILTIGLFQLSACMSPQKESPRKESAGETLPKSEQPQSQNKDSKGGEVLGPALIKKIAASDARATIVNIWASWCGPCKREFPMLMKLQQKWKKQGVDLIFVSVDEEAEREKARTFARSHGLDTPLLFASRPLGPFKTALNPKWPGMLPATFLYDENGILRFYWGGPVYEKEITPVVDGLLAGEKIDGEQVMGLAPGLVEH